MMENNDLEITEEQKKETLKIIRKAQLNIIWIVAKFGIGTFFANILSTFIGVSLMKDSNIDAQLHFVMVCCIVNTIFMCRYLYGQLKENTDVARYKIKNILMKNKTE